MKNKSNIGKKIIIYSLIIPIIFFLFGNIVINTVKEHKYTYIKEIETSKIILKEEYSIPTQLKIPKINIDINLENVTITSKGDLDVPKNFSSAGWFSLGPSPGEKGIAVITGHFGFMKGIPSVFNELHKLKKGDKLYITDKNGIINTFIVYKLYTYKQSDNTYNIFNSNDEKSYLNIITCHGIRDKTKKSYPNRLVVFSEKEVK